MKNTAFSFRRLLRSLVALMVIMSLLLCGCAGKDNNNDGDENTDKNNSSNSTLLGDGDGKLEVQDVVDSTTGIYGALLSALGGNMNQAQGAKMDIAVTLGDEILSGISQSFQQGGLGSDASWLKEIGLSMEMGYTAELMQMILDVTLGGKQVANAEMIMDMVNSAVYMSVPTLSNQYLGGKVQMAGGSVAGSVTSLPALMEQYGDIVTALPTEKELNTLLTRYINLAVEAMSDPTTGTSQLTAGGITMETATTTYTIRRSDVLNMAEAVLTTAKTDAELEKMLDAFNAWYNENAEQMDLHQELLTAIESGLEGIADAKENLEDAEMLTFTVHTSDDKQVGFELNLIDGYDTMAMHLYTLTSGSNTALDVKIMDAFALTGTGTVSGDKTNGNYTLSVEGEEMLLVELKDFSAGKTLKGTLRLRMGQGLIESMGRTNPIFSEDLMLEIQLDTNNNGGSITLVVYMGEQMGFTVAIKTQSTSVGNISVPSEYVNMEDSNAMQNWASNVSFDKLLSNLRNAGVPSELVDMLEQNLNGGGY